MPTIEIPIEWARAAGGARRLSVDGRTVGECLAGLGALFPDLAPRLGGHFEVFVNWESVRLRQGAATALSPSDVVQIVPLRA